MWSGPRNISTAMMRAWGARPDCAVVDEPLYAFYLTRTGLDHPARDEVIASQPTAWSDVVHALTEGPVPGGAGVFYQKHMTHHLLPEVDRARLAGLRHAFLVRDPARVLLSYARVRDQPTIEDLGLPQQQEIFERYGGPVLDARDVLDDPAAALRALCSGLDVPFTDAMLSWPPGPHPADGVWAAHWYSRVWASTGFAPPPGSGEPLPAHLEPLLARCQPYYDAVAAHRLRL
jgi:Sulfotransferase domain